MIGAAVIDNNDLVVVGEFSEGPVGQHDHACYRAGIVVGRKKGAYALPAVHPLVLQRLLALAPLLVLNHIGHRDPHRLAVPRRRFVQRISQRLVEAYESGSETAVPCESLGERITGKLIAIEDEYLACVSPGKLASGGPRP